MAIEPISTIITAQAQTAAPKATMSTAPEKINVESANTQKAAEQVDMTTKVVENAQNKGEANQEGQQLLNQQEQKAEPEKIKKAVESINKKMANSEAIYGIHEGTNRVTIKIVDKDTKEVIKELPPEKTLDMIAKAWEMAGILVDEKR